MTLCFCSWTAQATENGKLPQGNCVMPPKSYHVAVQVCSTKGCVSSPC